jgi:hypothetical protein
LLIILEFFLSDVQIITYKNPKGEILQKNVVHQPHEDIKLQLGPNMIPLHPKSSVYVNKNDILKIFTDKPALYSVRLAELVYGMENLRCSRVPDDNTSNHAPLNEHVLDAILSEFY